MTAEPREPRTPSPIHVELDLGGTEYGPWKPEAAVPREAEGLDIERLARGLIAYATEDWPLDEGGTIVSVALPAGPPDELAALIARWYLAASQDGGKPDGK